MNVIGDAFGAGIVYHLSKGELAQQDRENEERERLEALEAAKLEEEGEDEYPRV